MDSKIGLIIQLTGVMLITVLTMLLQRSLRSTALRFWAYAWLSLSFALICLRFAFELENHISSLYSLYFFGQYLFGLMLVAGCRYLYDSGRGRRLSDAFLVLFGIIPIALPIYSRSFDEMYSIHCLIMSGFFAAALLALRQSRMKSFGWRVMHISVAFLALDFFLYFALSTANRFAPMPVWVLQFNSVIDLVLETALGFGMIIVLLEKMLADAKSANAELADAHGQLEMLVNTDPLTAAFNRHAFYGFIKKGSGGAEPVTGCVGFFDVDNLKEINDNFGHPAGDQAIRAVARAIRDLIRAEDLIYRWGGDEFFVIMVGMTAEMAERRMARLESDLAGVRLDGLAESLNVGVSSGFSDFYGASELELAIKNADAEMYRRKEERKRSRKALSGFIGKFNSGAHRLRI